MHYDQRQLHQLAQDYLWYMFTGEEIAELCNVSQNVISGVKAMSDHPFFLNKCRPEWFLEWMRVHPEFQLTKAGAPKGDNRQGRTGDTRGSDSSTIPPKTIKRRSPRPKQPAG
jgi:hypothetical protein